MTTGIIIGAIVGLVFTFLIALAAKNQVGGHEWVAQVLIIGIIYIVLFAAIFGFLGHELDKENKIDETIQDTLNSNYDNVVNFHNDNTNKSFVSDGSKYTFDYDKKTKTLTVFTNTESSVDAVFVDGVKQNNSSSNKEKTSDNADKKKDCVSYQIDDENKTDNKVDTDNSSTTTAATDTDLQQKIQNKIQSKYNGAVMANFDTINLSGTFSCDNGQYSFTYEDNMLEVSNINNTDDVTYYKISD